MADNLTPRNFILVEPAVGSTPPWAGVTPAPSEEKIKMRDFVPVRSFLRSEAPRLAAAGAIAIYRAAVSPVIHAMNGPACRFEPSCSVYARDAIAEYGIVRGGIMAIWRIARCNPMGGHGFDPVRGRGAKVVR